MTAQASTIVRVGTEHYAVELPTGELRMMTYRGYHERSDVIAEATKIAYANGYIMADCILHKLTRIA